MGDDKLIKQCQALSRVPQLTPTIFIFDRDNPDIVSKIDCTQDAFKRWGNNVFSFAIPIPESRPELSAVCMELYFSDSDLATQDADGRRLFLSSEFNQSSGRHISDPNLSVAHKGKLSPGKLPAIRVLDAEVFDTTHKNVALSKAQFANSITNAQGAFGNFDFRQFTKLFSIIDKIIMANPQSLIFDGLDEYVSNISELSSADKLAHSVELAIRICKFAAIVFIGLTARYYGQTKRLDDRKFRPVTQSIVENFTSPSLQTLTKTARQCYHLVDHEAPAILQELRAAIGDSVVIGQIGDLLDDLEKVFPPDSRKGRTILKRNIKRPPMEFLFVELAKYENRISEIRSADLEVLYGTDETIWLEGVRALTAIFHTFDSLSFRVGNIVRVDPDGDDFVVRFTSYKEGRASVEEVTRKYADLIGDRLDTCEVLIVIDGHENWLDVYPFVTIKDGVAHSYTRTRAIGYEFRPLFRQTIDIIATKRKFSHAALGGTIAADRQILFWAPVAPAVSGTGVRANIPAHDPNQFVGRKTQITTIMDEVIQIPNENGLLHGPGGVGKTALLIELSRKLFEEGLPTKSPFKNIIWVSAKRDYYDPTLNVVESGTQQFRSLDQILLTILEFHGFEDAEQYNRFDQQWLVFELFAEQKTLLVLDNFETVPKNAQEEIIRFFGTDAKRYLIDKPDNFKVILTSREVIPSGFHQILLKGLDKRESNQLMQRLYEQYAQSGQVQLSEVQRGELYEATKGIPILIKHCYAQVFEYNMPLNTVVQNLIVAGNKVVEFSFAEIFRFVKEDELQRKILVLLELINRPLLVRQIGDILGTDEAHIERRIANLLNFQCIVRSPADVDDRYSINADVRLLAARLVHESIELTDAIRENIAKLAVEKRMDYNKEEFDAFVIFQQYLSNGLLVQAEDFIRDCLKKRPNSILFNLHYAKFLKDEKRQPREAIVTLERIRTSSGNDPQVLRLLMMYYAIVEPADFDQAHIYAMELEKHPLDDEGISMDIAEFYTEWSVALKMKVELDPIKEMLRVQKYKERADHAIGLLKGCADRLSHRWSYLMAQCQFNKWEYDSAKGNIDRAIARLPINSYLRHSYERLRGEIVRNGIRYQS